MKISVMMPTYNDDKTIEKSINSVLNQTYQNWELIIVNDGSTDDTEKIIKKIAGKEKRIIYIYQENKDQLNALYNASKYITGDYVTMFHSDDLLPTNDYYEKCVNFFNKNTNVDATIGDFKKIDINDNYGKDINISEYKKRSYIFPKMIINLGRNLYNDVFFAKKVIFEKYIIENYVKWNMPFWLYYDEKPKQINVVKVPFYTLKYRVHKSNYINNEMGQWNVVNGNLRTITTLIKYYDIPFFEFQFLLYRIFSKLKIEKLYIPFYLNREFKNKSKLIKKVIVARVGKTYTKSKYFVSLINFYQNINSNRTITINANIIDEDVYMGKDMRTFNKKIVSGKLPDIYTKIIEEMNNGFNNVVVKDKETFEKMRIILKFLNISSFVSIEISK